MLQVARVAQLECVVRDLLPGSSYFCVVRADSSVGESAPSQASIYTTPPAPPQPPKQLHLVLSFASSNNITYFCWNLQWGAFFLLFKLEKCNDISLQILQIDSLNKY